MFILTRSGVKGSKLTGVQELLEVTKDLNMCAVTEHVEVMNLDFWVFLV